MNRQPYFIIKSIFQIFQKFQNLFVTLLNWIPKMNNSVIMLGFLLIIWHIILFAMLMLLLYHIMPF